jgi:hypothetical protein
MRTKGTIPKNKGLKSPRTCLICQRTNPIYDEGMCRRHFDKWKHFEHEYDLQVLLSRRDDAVRCG